MADGKKERSRRHLKPIREGEAASTHRGVAQGGAISWPSAWAGLVVAVGVMVFLAALGLGLDIGGPASTDGSFLDRAWAGAMLTISLFAGGFFLSASRPAPAWTGAALQGLVLWGLFISSALTITALSSTRATAFLEARLAGAPASTADGLLAAFILLMLAGAILGSMAGTYQFSRK